MSKIFGVNFAAHDDNGTLYQFTPGNDVPEWLESTVGDHCLILPPEDDSVSDENTGNPPVDTDLDDGGDSDDDAHDAPAEVVLDFTKPKPVRGAKK